MKKTHHTSCETTGAIFPSPFNFEVAIENSNSKSILMLTFLHPQCCTLFIRDTMRYQLEQCSCQDSSGRFGFQNPPTPAYLIIALTGRKDSFGPSINCNLCFILTLLLVAFRPENLKEAPRPRRLRVRNPQAVFHQESVSKNAYVFIRATLPSYPTIQAQAL